MDSRGKTTTFSHTHAHTHNHIPPTYMQPRRPPLPEHIRAQHRPGAQGLGQNQGHPLGQRTAPALVEQLRRGRLAGDAVECA